MDEHIPVLLNEVIEGLNIKDDGIYVDLTLGRAGHSREILKRCKKGLLIGIDQDEAAINSGEKRLKEVGANYRIVRDNFVNLERILKELNIDKVDGILMDLGVSSPQFDDKNRGFSYRNDAPLDMRMDQRNPLTAETIVNTYSLNDLTKVFKEYGEEKYAYSIAKAIVKERETKRIITTYDLVEIIKTSKPKKELLKVGHPAKQVFQALRIEVNDELNVLANTLMIATKHLKSGGRLAVITFHSLEDRMVKNYFKSLSVIEGNRNNLPDINKETLFSLINKHAIAPSESEIEENHRSKSAKLRILERK